MDVQVMCKSLYFVQAMCYTASVCILTVISLERFVAIVYPMHSRRLHSMSLLLATIIGVWTVAAASGLPYLFIYDILSIPSGDADGSLLQFCMMFPPLPEMSVNVSSRMLNKTLPHHHPFNIRAYACATFILWYALPLAMMAVVYARISVVLWRSSHGPRVMSMRATPPATSATLAVHHDASSSTSQPSDVSPAEKCVVVPGDSTDQEDAPHAGGGISGGSGARLLRSLGFQRRAAARRQDHLPSPHCLITVEPSSDDAGPGSAVELRSLTSGQETRRQVAVMTTTSEQTALSARRKVIRLLIAVVVSFAVCVLPYHVRVLWQEFSPPQLSDWQLVIPPLTFVFYYLNSGLNPLLYAFLSNRFRSSLSDVLHCRYGATTQTARVTYDVGGHVTMNTRTVTHCPHSQRQLTC